MVALLDLFVAVFSGYLYDKTRGREQLDVAKDDAAAIGDKKRGFRRKRSSQLRSLSYMQSHRCLSRVFTIETKENHG